MIVMKTIILSPIKIRLNNYKIGKRPMGGFNCNMFNCGGKPHGGGMPSGHMVLLGLLSTIVYNIYRINNKTSILYIYTFLIITTAVSRYYLSCHTTLQIIVGYLLGLLIGIIYYYIDILADKHVKRYHENREDFYNHFS